MTFHDPELLDPIVHCFARCFFCKKLIAISSDESDDLILDERECPHCGMFIDENKIRSSFAFNTLYTSAITSANKIQSLDPAFIPFLAGGILLAVMGFPNWIRITNLLCYVFTVVPTLVWLYRYWYRFRIIDIEYLEAVSGVKKSFLLWLFANLLNWSLLLIPPSWELTW